MLGDRRLDISSLFLYIAHGPNFSAVEQTLKIRKYTPADREQLLLILKNNVPQYFAETELEDYATYLHDEVEDYFVVVVGEQILGAGGINYFPAKQTARISWDVVDVPFHHQGIGTLLLEHRLEWIRTKKPQIKTLVVRTSQHAFAFYEKMGFRLRETHKDYWAEGFDMYKMVQALSN